MNSGNLFYVTYQFSADDRIQAEKEAKKISLEQTAELPSDAIPDDLHEFVGDVSELKQLTDHRWQAKIHFKKELVSGDSVQFLNVIFGNVSIKPGVRIVDLDRQYLAELLPGPGTGTEGLRKLLSVHNRAISCTALKPVGSSPRELAAIAGQFAAGGIDIIKDDHGLVNQPMADFKTRVKHCVKAIKNGEQQSGKKTLYFPNITGTADEIQARANIAGELGAGGILLAPQLSGLHFLTDITRSHPNFPVIAHPAFSGPYTIHKNSGFIPSVYFGLLWRALGADCIIYPNAGGRFSYTRQQCLDINKECRSLEMNVRTCLPVPAGGINRNSLKSWIRDYGPDTLFLIGGSLYKHPEGPKIAAKEFQKALIHHD